MSYQPIRPYGNSPADRLTVNGFYFVTPDGQLHRRRSITAFTLSKRAAEGRLDEARRFMDWAVSIGANEFRVFTESDWTGQGLGVEPGWPYNRQACDWVALEASLRGCHVEFVAFTYDYDVDAMARHLEAVDALCMAHPNALLEVANEPPVNDIPLTAILNRYTPKTPGWASGAYETPFSDYVQIGQTDDGKPIYGPTPDAKVGPALTDHTPRKAAWSRCAKDAWEYHDGAGPWVPFQPPYTGPIMLDEPPQVEQTIRDEGAAQWPAEDDWRAYGAGCAFWAAGGTLHGNPTFQRCEVPTDPRVLACSAAFYAGMADVPLQRYVRYDRGEPPTPENDGSRRYFRWNEAGQKYQLTVRPYSFGAV